MIYFHSKWSLKALFYPLLFAQDGLLSQNLADGILCTEYEICDGLKDYVIPPTILNAQCVRAAQKYNIVFSYVRENFAIAGLLSSIEVTQNCNITHFLMHSSVDIMVFHSHRKL